MAGRPRVDAPALRRIIVEPQAHKDVGVDADARTLHTRNPADGSRTFHVST